MSNRERVMQLIDDVPDDKLIFVVNMLESLKAYVGEGIEPDEWDLRMIAEAESTNDGMTVTFEELLKRDGLTYEDLQD